MLSESCKTLRLSLKKIKGDLACFFKDCHVICNSRQIIDYKTRRTSEKPEEEKLEYDLGRLKQIVKGVFCICWFSRREMHMLKEAGS